MTKYLIDKNKYNALITERNSLLVKVRKIEQLVNECDQLPFAPCLIKDHKCLRMEIKEILKSGANDEQNN